MKIKRIIEKRLSEQLISNKVNLVFGTRRVGKSFLLKTLIAKHSFKTLLLQGEDSDTQQLLA